MSYFKEIKTIAQTDDTTPQQKQIQMDKNTDGVKIQIVGGSVTGFEIQEDGISVFNNPTFLNFKTGVDATINSTGVDINIDNSEVDHNQLFNTHNLTTDIDHNTITNTHNLTTDIDHNQLTNYTITQHRIINDAGTSTTELWSASKIQSELNGLTGGMTYKGTWQPSTGSYPVSPSQGDVWKATDSGTVSGILYTSGDMAVYNGSAWDKWEGGTTWAEIDKTVSSIADITTKSHTLLTDIGTNTHPQIDSHISNTNNPHSVTIDQVTPTTTKGDILVENGSNVVRLPVGTNGQFLTADSTEATGLKYIDVALDLDSLPGTQVRRTTNYTVTTAWTDITFDTTDIETKPSTIEHDTTNTARINIKETGLYMVNYTAELDGGDYQIRSRLDDTTVIPGSERQESNYAGEIHEVSGSFLVNLTTTGTHYITLQMLQTSATTLYAGINLTVVKLRGTKGDTGATGPQGPAGNNLINVADEGTNLPNTPHSKLNFVGDIVTASDAGSGTATITINNDFKSSLFQARKTTTQATTGTYTDVTGWLASDFEDSDYTWNATTGILTINTTGVYDISTHILGNGAGNRCQLQVKLVDNNGDIAGAEDKQYATRNTTQESGSVQLNSFIKSFNANDTLKVQISDIGDSLDCIARLTVKRLR